MKTVKVFTDSKAFEIAADKTRRRIIHLLRARVLSVSQIADELEMTPQAIYHHIRKMLEVGLVEIAKEERIEHFIETYYQATAEIFHFTYGEIADPQHRETHYKELLNVLNRVGLIQKIDESIINRYIELTKKKNEIYSCCQPEIAVKISEIDDLDFFTKQEALELSTIISLNDKQFEELLSIEKEIRMLLKEK